MSVAVFSKDALLARMLLLEARRCGMQEAAPEEARVWLIDLDHLPPVPRVAHGPIQIGFCADPDALAPSVPVGLYALLALPFQARQLQQLLHRTEVGQAQLLQDAEGFSLGGKRLHFSKTEEQLLELLYQNRHRVVLTREISAILGESAENSNAAAVYLYRLRRKLEKDGTMRIRTVRGVGYQWMGDEWR